MEEYIKIPSQDLPFEELNRVTKQAVLDYGSVGISYSDAMKAHSHQSEYSAYYNPYNNASAGSLHAVTIVGWDDNFPKDSFREYDGKKPAQDGAWLVKSSSPGGDWLWMSYETAIGERYAFKLELKGEQKIHRYQNDFFDSGEDFFLGGLNVFTATGNQTLESVGVTLSQPDLPYLIKVYKNLEEGAYKKESPDAVIKKQYSFSGFYTVPLPESLPLKEGERFSVSVEWDISQGSDIPNASNAVAFSAGLPENVECYYTLYGGNQWEKCGSYSHEGVPRIKAFTVDTDEPISPESEPEPEIPAESTSLFTIRQENEFVNIRKTEHLPQNVEEIQILFCTYSGDGSTLTDVSVTSVNVSDLENLNALSKPDNSKLFILDKNVFQLLYN